jgi:hypothetical protein
MVQKLRALSCRTRVPLAVHALLLTHITRESSNGLSIREEILHMHIEKTEGEQASKPPNRNNHASKPQSMTNF